LIGMSIVFECRNLHKRFAAGAAGCTASVHVLRGVDLTLHAGDCIAVVGPRGAGKSTLLLCAAGLLKPDAGEVRWYGHSSLTEAARTVAYYWTTAGYRRSNIGDAGLHLVDIAVARDALMREWIDARRERGDAVVFGTHDESIGRALASRVLFMRAGRLASAARADAVSRVAEPVA
jgi:ABC-type multidrug transport system ATPase subunit